ncbi:sodium-coupled neutral amino acid transporter 9-like [Venturia canescens]|uniref:sodium-coupled neutral amino acid transporter 9-like n=1 Tax=Venturia canescens TaxID=32260 RepID=UPI001C9D3600|nr:sodium-coupled neutral amino acid transporter 9-like [Venturia canescens]XP_043289380.1 sodium-coupled neutral amino acid transporter 9-like [Venturia canescens]
MSSGWETRTAASANPRLRSPSNEAESATPEAGSKCESWAKSRQNLLPKNQAQVRVFNLDRNRSLVPGKKYSSPNDTDSPAENQEDDGHRIFKRKHRRCWSTSRTTLHQDSGSESAPLLSSASHTSAGSVMFPNSETSDLDDIPAGDSSRYGSIGAASLNSVVSVLPRKLPPLVQENPVPIPDPGNTTPGLHFLQNQCYEIRDMEMLLSSEKYDGNETFRATRDIRRGCDRIRLPSILDIDTSLQLDPKPKQSSLVTIFSIWNTILGSSLLTMPWGFLMAGLIPGFFMLLVMSGLCLYTAYRLLRIHKYHGGDERIEVPELCRIYLGPFADYVARAFSISVLLGANIAYWILMSNVLYNSINFFYDQIAGFSDQQVIDNATRVPEVLCPKQEVFNHSNDAKPTDRTYDNLGPAWDLYKTVPFFLAIPIFPLLNFNTTTFFTKFNSLGTIAVMYLVAFVITKSSSWGINMSTAAWDNSWRLQSTFPALTGMLTMSFFIHNIIITIMQHNRDQGNNARDLSIAYILVTLTYFTVGPIFFISFPLAKYCIQDNFLNNFQKWDPLTVGARVVLLFQLLTVFPLINYMLRIRLLSVISSFVNSTRCNVIIVNLFVVTICIVFARYMPHIGTVIRYTGAISGMIYIFTLPSILHLAILCKKGEATIQSVILHLCIPVIGAANFVGQLFVSFN